MSRPDIPTPERLIRPAKTNEARHLTAISFESKKYWGYPAQYIQVWENELTISPAYIAANEVWVCEQNGVIVGYCSLVALGEPVDLAGIEIPAGYWLEHLFIAPQWIGRGLGKRLLIHLRNRCKVRGIATLSVLADPNSRGFYEKMGFRYLQEYPSTIPGRTTPLLEWRI